MRRNISALFLLALYGCAPVDRSTLVFTAPYSVRDLVAHGGEGLVASSGQEVITVRHGASETFAAPDGLVTGNLFATGDSIYLVLEGNSLGVLDIKSRKWRMLPSDPAMAYKPLYQPVVAPAKKTLCVGSQGCVYVIALDGSVRNCITRGTGGFVAASVSPGQKYFASGNMVYPYGSEPQALLLLDSTTGAIVMEQASSDIFDLAFLSDSELVVARGNLVELLDVPSLRVKKTLFSTFSKGHFKCLSVYDSRIVAAIDDTSVHYTDTSVGKVKSKYVSSGDDCVLTSKDELFFTPLNSSEIRSVLLR